MEDTVEEGCWWRRNGIRKDNEWPRKTPTQQNNLWRERKTASILMSNNYSEVMREQKTELLVVRYRTPSHSS